MKTERVRSTFLVAVSALLPGVFGCPSLTPPPEAVLEGTWELVPSVSTEPQLTHWHLTFDANGHLSQVKYTFVDHTTVTLKYPPGSVSVDGDQIHISSTASGNGLTFDGTLNSETAPTSAAGTLTSNVIFGELEISVSQGEATLVKQ